ncbi:hypothetical protein BafPKo_AC0006 (plasmid) [Borreliella afzelii PKo]|uniref:Uncharacterized protein n=1 Tax=Borreliella afzelii (strain PKo) TaxID=390236 RepID=G0ITR0_BORAP|nr:hypothetical protein BafPKo_AC0006 [Borreliella afzelii PKo]
MFCKTINNLTYTKTATTSTATTATTRYYSIISICPNASQKMLIPNKHIFSPFLKF